MAEINLRDYLARLENLVNSGEYTQVVHHCRHILQYFPRHADTYRLLGRALLDNNKWQEAAEVFNRLQSVNPSDYTAHIALAEISNQIKRPDDAIWHLERAFEQQPNNQALMDNLRDLYRKHRRMEFNRVQLTAGAAARQYIRNGLFEQAIRVLQEALQQAPDRVDLRLLLAQTYREAGYYVEAGETSLDVLQTLPDCLDANLILAELWLSLQRPSDAQRYLERVQSVDPYAALAMVEAGEVSPEAFRLPELDFRRSVEREVLSGTPDWLEGVNTPAQPPRVPTTDLPGWGSFAPASGAQTDDLQLGDDFRQELPADWMKTGELPSSGPLPPVERPKRGGLTGGLLARFKTSGLPGTGQVDGQDDDLPPMDMDFEAEAPFEPAPILPPVPPPRSKPPTQEAPMVRERFANPDETKRFDDSLMDPLGAPTSDEILEPSVDENDPLYWMKASGLVIEDSIRTTTNVEVPDTNALGASDSDDPLGWMQDYGTGLLSDEPAPARYQPSAMLDDEPVTVEAEEADPMAWLRGSGVEIVNDAPARPRSTQSAPAAEVDPLDWLSDDDALLNEALDMEAMVDNTAPPTRFTAPPTAQMNRQDAMPQSPDNDQDWLRSQNEPEPESFDWSETEKPTEAPPPSKRATGLLSRFRTGTLPVGGEEEAPPPHDRTPDFLKDIAAPAAPPAAAAATGWLDDMMTSEPASSPADDFDWNAAPAPNAATGWLDNMMDAEPPPQPADDMPDWLGGMNIPPPPPKTTSEWYQSPESDEPPTDVKRTTGLLNRFKTGTLPGTNPIAEQPSAQQPPPSTGWLDDMMTSEPTGTADEASWLMDTGPLSSTGKLPATSDLDWAKTTQDVTPAQSGWLDDMMGAEPGQGPDEANWLMDTGPLSATGNLPGTGELDWMQTPADNAPANTGWLDNMMASDQPTARDDIPDWLGGAKEPAAPTTSSTGWFASADPESEEPPPPVEGKRSTGLLNRFRTGNLPTTGSMEEPALDDWSQLQSPAASASTWGDADFSLEEPTASADAPDWLAQTGTLMETAPQAEEANWLAQTGGLLDTAPTAQDDVPAWLSQTGDLMQTGPVEQADVPAWLAQTGDLLNTAPAAQDEFEWSLDEPNTATSAPATGWLDEIQPSEAATADWSQPAADTGDWDEPAYDEPPVAGTRTTGLLNRFQTGQLPVTSDLESGFSQSEPEATPDWLSALEPTPDMPSPADRSSPVDDIDSWMAQTGSLLEAAPAEESSDWATLDEEQIPDQPSMTTTGLLNRFKTGNLPATSDLEPTMSAADFGWEPEDQAAVPSSSDVPEWLTNLEAPAPEPEPEPEMIPRAGTGPIDEIDWGAAAEPVAEADAAFYDDQPVQQADVPDWLAQMEPAEPEPAIAAPRTPTGPIDEIDWGAAAEPVAEADAAFYDDEPVQQADVPDWLAQMEPAEPEPAIAAPRTPTGPIDEIDWGAAAEPVAEADAAFYDDQPVQQADVPDWLAQMEPAEPEPAIAAPRTPTGPIDEIDWGAAAEPVAEADAAFYDDQPVQQADVPDWLTQMEPPPQEMVGEIPLGTVDWTVDAQAELEDEALLEAPVQAPDMSDWPTQIAQPEMAEPEATDDFSWMTQADDALAEPTDGLLEPAATSEDDLSWMRASELETGEAEPEMTVAAADEPAWDEPQAEPAWMEEAPIGNDELLVADETANRADMGWAAAPVAAAGAALAGGALMGGRERQPEPAEDDWDLLETSPALNAPDWLNDMVPGLDINYGAEDDTATEMDYVPAATINLGTMRPKVDYAWLMEIAEEESRSMLPITDTVLARKRRYIFTREPIWLRHPTERRDATAAAESDIDLPPWLQ